MHNRTSSKSGDFVPERESCIFCGRLDSVKPIGGNKGICSTCAESLTNTLRHTEEGERESRRIKKGIDLARDESDLARDEIRNHISKEHKQTKDQKGKL